MMPTVSPFPDCCFSPPRVGIGVTLLCALLAAGPSAARADADETPAPTADAPGAESAASSATAEEEALIAEVAEKHLKRIQAAAADHSASLVRLIRAGGLQPVTMTEPGNVEARLELLDDWCQRCAAFAEMLATARAALERQLLAAGVSADHAARFAARTSTTPGRTAMMSLRLNEAHTCAAAMEQLQILIDHPWRWDTEGGHVVFTNPADQDAARRYAELAGQLEKLEAGRDRLMPKAKP